MSLEDLIGEAVTHGLFSLSVTVSRKEAGEPAAWQATALFKHGQTLRASHTVTGHAILRSPVKALERALTEGLRATTPAEPEEDVFG